MTTTQVQRYCGAMKKNGEPCRQPSGWGTNHVGWGTCKRHGGSTSNSQKAAVKAQVASLATEVDADPREVLLATIRKSWGAVSWLEQKVASIDPDEDLKAFAIWQQLLGEWIDRSGKYAKLALDAGVAERLVRLQESEAKQVAAVLRTVMDGLQLSQAQQAQVPELMRQALTSLATGDTD